MAEAAPGYEHRPEEPQCYNCGVAGHWAIACPEPTRQTPAGLAAWRNSTSSGNTQQQGGNRDYQRGGHKKAKGPVITKYAPPPTGPSPANMGYPNHEYHSQAGQYPAPPLPGQYPIPAPFNHHVTQYHQPHQTHQYQHYASSVPQYNQYQPGYLQQPPQTPGYGPSPGNLPGAPHQASRPPPPPPGYRLSPPPLPHLAAPPYSPYPPVSPFGHQCHAYGAQQGPYPPYHPATSYGNQPPLPPAPSARGSQFGKSHALSYSPPVKSSMLSNDKMGPSSLPPKPPPSNVDRSDLRHDNRNKGWGDRKDQQRGHRDNRQNDHASVRRPSNDLQSHHKTRPSKRKRKQAKKSLQSVKEPENLPNGESDQYKKVGSLTTPGESDKIAQSKAELSETAKEEGEATVLKEAVIEAQKDGTRPASDEAAEEADEWKWEYEAIFKRPNPIEGPCQVGRPLPAEYTEAVLPPRDLDAASLGSDFVKDDNLEEYTRPVHKTEYWCTVKFDPAFIRDGRFPNGDLVSEFMKLEQTLASKVSNSEVSNKPKNIPNSGNSSRKHEASEQPSTAERPLKRVRSEDSVCSTAKGSESPRHGDSLVTPCTDSSLRLSETPWRKDRNERRLSDRSSQELRPTFRKSRQHTESRDQSRNSAQPRTRGLSDSRSRSPPRRAPWSDSCHHPLIRQRSDSREASRRRSRSPTHRTSGSVNNFRPPTRQRSDSRETPRRWSRSPTRRTPGSINSYRPRRSRSPVHHWPETSDKTRRRSRSPARRRSVEDRGRQMSRSSSVISRSESLDSLEVELLGCNSSKEERQSDGERECETKKAPKAKRRRPNVESAFSRRW